MGDQNINVNATLEERVAFTRDVLTDPESLQYMVQNNMIEKGVIRIEVVDLQFKAVVGIQGNLSITTEYCTFVTDTYRLS